MWVGGAKRGVKGHPSPAGAGEYPRGLVLACDTKGQVERCLLPGVWKTGAARCLPRVTRARAADPDRVGTGLGNFHRLPAAFRSVVSHPDYFFFLGVLQVQLVG